MGGQYFTCTSQGTEHFPAKCCVAADCGASGNDEDGDVQSDNSQPEDKHLICKVSTNLAAQKKG